MTKREKDRCKRLMPGGTPRWIRCYDNGGTDVENGTIDRYTVIFTGRYRHNTGGEFFYLGMDSTPCRPQGFGQHGSFPYQCDTLDGKWPPAIGRKNHLGTRIAFADLPGECRDLVISDYKDLWNI